MTCIIGYKHDGEVYMIADSAAGSDYVVKQPKLAKSGKLLLGYTTSFRMGQLLEFSIAEFPEIDGLDEYKYMVTLVVPFIRERFIEGGYATIDNNEETAGTFLMAVNSRLFTVESNYSVREYLGEYSAIGCGARYAFGAMAILTDCDNHNAGILIRAMRSVAKHNGFVCAPFRMMSTKNDKIVSWDR